jgi:hypothetical protein
LCGATVSAAILPANVAHNIGNQLFADSASRVPFQTTESAFWQHGFLALRHKSARNY